MVAGSRRAAGVPAAGRRRPGGGVRGGREGRPAAAAGRAVRAGHVGDGEDRPGHPRPGRPGSLLGAVAAHRQDRRRARHRHDGAVLYRRAAGQNPPAEGSRQADRLRRLPAGEDRVPHADPGLVPQAGRRHRPGMRAGHRRTAHRQRPLPAPRRPGRHRAGRQARPVPAGSRLRQGDGGRGPVLPYGQGHPGRRRRARHAPCRGRGRRRLGVPARPRLVRERHPHARHDHQRCGRPREPGAGAPHDRRHRDRPQRAGRRASRT